MSLDLRRHVLPAAICLALVGCQEPAQRLNAPPQGHTDRPAESQAFYTYQVDNALMSDMSIADVHFVAHTGELNSLGTTKLARMAKLIATYGGTVRYSTLSKDQTLVDQRLAHVKEFLGTTGIDLTNVDVTVAQAGASHTSAEQISEANQRGMEAAALAGQNAAAAGSAE